MNRHRSERHCITGWINHFGQRSQQSFMNDLTARSDEELMTAYQQGDLRAFEMLLSRHQRPLFNFIRRQTGSHLAAEDLFQDVFMRIIKSAPTYSANAKFTTWLYTIARNLCIDASRRGKYRKTRSLDGPSSSKAEGQTLCECIADSTDGVEHQVFRGELRKRLNVAIETLSEEQREVFLMREYLSLSFREISEIIGGSENTIKSRMRYALAHLRKELSDFQELAQTLPEKQGSLGSRGIISRI